MRVAPVLLVSVALGFAAALVAWRSGLRLPPQWNPWARLDVSEQPGWLTRFKLDRLGGDPAACLGALGQSGARFAALPDRSTGENCGLRDAVQLRSADAALAPSTALACPTAVAFALWQRHVLEPAAMRRFGAKVTRIEHFGSYACRNIDGRASAPRSEHATANAIDVAAFVLADGRRIRVAEGWRGKPAEAAFLHEAAAGACTFFGAVLGPEYNAAHRDHLHLDRGIFHMCR